MEMDTKPKKVRARSSNPSKVSRARRPRSRIVLPKPEKDAEANRPINHDEDNQQLITAEIPEPKPKKESRKRTATSVMKQLEFLRGITQADILSEGLNFEGNCTLSPCPFSPKLPSPFPAFCDLMDRSHLNFETRVEKIEDYNVIRRSSVIWRQFEPSNMRCFSMNDYDFII